MTDPTDIPLPAGAQFDQGVWAQVLRMPSGSGPHPALFLDRDGVVALEAHYLHKVEDVALTPGAIQTIARANEKNIPVVLVTNQAGIGYGYFAWDAFIAVQDKIISELAAGGATLDGVFACPFHAKAKPPYQHPDHPARKPNPGMLLNAAARMNLDLARSWIVGDRELDLLAGRNAGLSGGIHVMTGHGAQDGERENALKAQTPAFQAIGCPSIREAATHIPLLA